MNHLPPHIYRQWKLFNSLIDLALDVGMLPWSAAVEGAAGIWEEWGLE